MRTRLRITRAADDTLLDSRSEEVDIELEDATRTNTEDRPMDHLPPTPAIVADDTRIGVRKDVLLFQGHKMFDA